MRKKEAERIEKESDLSVPVAAITKDKDKDQDKEDKGFLDKFGGVIVGGLISGGIFFGLGKFLNWFSRSTEDEQTEDQV